MTRKRVLSLVVKLAIAFGLIWVLYLQIFVSNDINQLFEQFNLSISGGWYYFLGVVALLPVNWMLEGRKWRILINTFQSFSWRQSLSSVLAGVSLAIMTPGRIGEYGGRMVGIKPVHRPKAVLANLISSLSQNIVNIGIGALGAVWYVQRFNPLHEGVFLSLLFITLGMTSIMLLVYFRIDLLDTLMAYLPKWKWVEKVRSSASSFRSVEIHTLFSILGISMLRYATYTTQYVLLILFFGISNDVLTAYLGVITVFFLQSNLPLPPALSILARGEMAIFLWSVFTTNVLGIVAATFTLWFINLVIPAIIGMIIISQSKLLEE